MAPEASSQHQPTIPFGTHSTSNRGVTMTWRRWLSFTSVLVATGLYARPAAAQLAPTGGDYADQPSDTGFSGGVDSSGGYSASVPLDVPGARGGLPIPVSIVYGGGGVGAAGLGWDVPLSYIIRDNTIARRRPKVTDTGSPQAREAMSLVLEGRSMDLVRSGSDWVPRRNAPDMLVRQQGDGNWVVYDGQGRTYSFTVAATTGGVSMWLLSSITGVGGSKVELDYSITTPTVPGAAASRSTSPT